MLAPSCQCAHAIAESQAGSFGTAYPQVTQLAQGVRKDVSVQLGGHQLEQVRLAQRQ